MVGPIGVSDAALHPERNQHFADVLKTSPQLIRVFEAAYAGKRKDPVDARFLAVKTGIKEKRVTELATALARKGMLDQPRRHAAKYERIPSVADDRKKILRLARNPRSAAKQITMRTPRATNATVVRHFKIPKPFKSKVDQIFIDEIKEFGKVRKHQPGTISKLPKPISESLFKKGLIALLPGTEEIKDWGGERHDVFTSHLTINGKRIPSAFALKGPAQKPPLTPGKMGKNGDQIQRLVILASARLFIIQFEGKVEHSVHEQLEHMLRAKSSMTGQDMMFCIIGEMDSARLRKAYPASFK